MDDRAFDEFSRAMARGLPRRRLLARLGAGGLGAALLGTTGRVPARAAAPTAQAATCQLDLVAHVRLGASAGVTLGGAVPGELRAQLAFGFDDGGAISSGSMRLASGQEVPVVGQALGRALHLRVATGNQLLILVGTAEQDLATCQGAVDGMVTGPQLGDLGDWHATATALGQRGSSSGAASSGGTGGASSGSSGSGSNSSGGSGSGSSQPPTQAPATSAPPPTDSGGCGQLGAPCAGRDDCCAEFDCGGGICRVRHSDCVSGDDPCSSTPECCFDRVCTTGRCVAPGETPLECPDGQTACGGECVDVQTDTANCGACGVSCGGACENGTCVDQPACPDGQTDCGGFCTDTTSDLNNCGGCGTACPPNAICSDGTCFGGGDPPPVDPAPVACTGNLVDCGGVCVDFQTDPFNCGGCGNFCITGCSGGACAVFEIPGI